MVLSNKVISITALIIVTLTSVFLAYTLRTSAQVDPSSANNQSLNRLRYLLDISNLKPIGLNINNSSRQIFFLIDSELNNPTEVIFSQDKDIYLQVNSLQKILNIVKMNHHSVKIIDLASSRPYATFENN
jgi:hypothetical protein